MTKAENAVSYPWPLRLISWFSPSARAYLASVTARVDDSAGPGWIGSTVTRWDDPDVTANQIDSLEAWRRSPLARRIVGLTTDFVVGDGISLRSKRGHLQGFISDFWNHPENRMALRLPDMCDELTRSGELFPVLHRQADRMSVVRFVPAADIVGIEWTPGDYEQELEYREGGIDGLTWRSPRHAQADSTPAWMLHYAINRPIGCMRGEGDLNPILVWLKRYNGWLEDRARLNWASRMFLWFVTVPPGKVAEKRQQYRQPPEPGSVIVKDEGETWEMQTPNLGARDASADGKALRYMIAGGAGVPLHMLSEAEGTNLATATAQADPTMRHYRRRQQYLCWLLSDMTIRAYNRWAEPGRYRRATHADVEAVAPDVSREDNNQLATAGRDVVAMLAALRDELLETGIPMTAELQRRTVEMSFRFAGEILDDEEINAILGVDQNV